MAEDKQLGAGLDAHGNHAEDPTSNVKELVEAAILRLDDLRAASEKRFDEVTECKHEHLKELMELRAEHGEQLRKAETERINAIRAVDVSAVAIATERATATANALANQVSASAEVLRALVANTATATAAASTASYNQLSERLSLLERGGFEAAGKATVIDPQMAKLVSVVESLRTTASEGTGRQGLSQPLLMLVVASFAAIAGGIIQNLLGG